MNPVDFRTGMNLRSYPTNRFWEDDSSIIFESMNPHLKINREMSKFQNTCNKMKWEHIPMIPKMQVDDHKPAAMKTVVASVREKAQGTMVCLRHLRTGEPLKSLWEPTGEQADTLRSCSSNQERFHPPGANEFKIHALWTGIAPTLVWGLLFNSLIGSIGWFLWRNYCHHSELPAINTNIKLGRAVHNGFL